MSSQPLHRSAKRDTPSGLYHPAASNSYPSSAVPAQSQFPGNTFYVLDSIPEGAFLDLSGVLGGRPGGNVFFTKDAHDSRTGRPLSPARVKRIPKINEDERFETIESPSCSRARPRSPLTTHSSRPSFDKLGAYSPSIPDRRRPSSTTHNQPSRLPPSPEDSPEAQSPSSTIVNVSGSPPPLLKRPPPRYKPSRRYAWPRPPREETIEELLARPRISRAYRQERPPPCQALTIFRATRPSSLDEVLAIEASTNIERKRKRALLALPPCESIPTSHESTSLATESQSTESTPPSREKIPIKEQSKSRTKARNPAKSIQVRTLQDTKSKDIANKSTGSTAPPRKKARTMQETKSRERPKKTAVSTVTPSEKVPTMQESKSPERAKKSTGSTVPPPDKARTMRETKSRGRPKKPTASTVTPSDNFRPIQESKTRVRTKKKAGPTVPPSDKVQIIQDTKSRERQKKPTVPSEPPSDKLSTIEPRKTRLSKPKVVKSVITKEVKNSKISKPLPHQTLAPSQSTSEQNLPTSSREPIISSVRFPRQAKLKNVMGSSK